MSETVRGAFAGQSRACAKLGSPFMARLMTLCAERLTEATPVGAKVLNWPGDPTAQADSVPLRFAGALHALKLQGNSSLGTVYPPYEAGDQALWDGVESALASSGAFLLRRLDSPPQTNEVRRSAALIPALHMLTARFGLPIRLVEIGCSAGLNLRADRFHLTAGAQRFGPGEATVRLTPDWPGTPPAQAEPTVCERIGLDINPLDPAADAERLLSYVWPDQPDRIARTEAAIAIAQSVPATLITGDAVDWLRTSLRPQPGHLTLLFHTIAWQYLPEASRAEGDRLIAEAGAQATKDAPLSRFAMEAAGPHAALTLETWPGEGIIPLGRADYHGRWVEWDRATLTEGIDAAT